MYDVSVFRGETQSDSRDGKVPSLTSANDEQRIYFTGHSIFFCPKLHTTRSPTLCTEAKEQRNCVCTRRKC